MTKWFRYVVHADVPKFLANGWSATDSLQGTHHGAHAVLMVWEGDHEPA